MRLFWMFSVFVIFLLTSVQFGESEVWSHMQLKHRQKRLTLLEECPENPPPEKCLEQVKQKSTGCYHFEIYHPTGQLTNESSIAMSSCGLLYCGPGKRFALGDPSKPYPLCCEHCEDI